MGEGWFSRLGIAPPALAAGRFRVESGSASADSFHYIISTMAGIAAEALEVLGIRREVGNTRIDHALCVLHQLRQTRIPASLARRFKNEPQAFLDQILELAAAQCRLRFGLTVTIIWHFDGGLHSTRFSSCLVSERIAGQSGRRPLSAALGSFRRPLLFRSHIADLVGLNRDRFSFQEMRQFA